MSLNQQLLTDIKFELAEDFSNFGSKFETWSEVCLDMPSGDLLDLLKQIPEGEEHEYYDKIDEMIKEIGQRSDVVEGDLYRSLCEVIEEFEDDHKDRDDCQEIINNALDSLQKHQS